MWFDISIDKNLYENTIFLFGYENNFLKKEVQITIPTTPREYGNMITIKISHYLWVKDNMAEKKVLQFNFHVSEYTVEFWNHELKILKEISNNQLLDAILANCNCNQEDCNTSYNLKKIFIKELLKYLWREKLSVQTKIYKEECEERHLGFTCYKVHDLQKFR